MTQEELVLFKEVVWSIKTMADSSVKLVAALEKIEHKLEEIAEEICELSKNVETKGG